MNWIEYLTHVAGTDQAEIARAAKVAPSTVSRWLSGSQGVKPEAAANFARKHGRPVLEAFVAAGFLSPQEANVRPAAAPDYSQLTNDELLELVRSRMSQGGGGEHGHGSAPIEVPAAGPADQPARQDFDLAALDADPKDGFAGQGDDD